MRILLASIYSQLASIGLAFFVFVLVYLLSSIADANAPFSGLVNGFYAFCTYMLVLVPFSLLAMKRLRYRHWLRISIAAVVSELVTIYIIQTFDTGLVKAYGSTVLESIVIMLAVSGVVFLLSWKIDTKLEGRMSAVPAFLALLLVTIGATNGILFPAVYGLSQYQQTLYRNNDIRNLKTQITNMKFVLYMPNSLPSDYTVESIVPYDSSSTELLYLPQSLTLTIRSASSQKYMKIVEFRAPSTFNPPTDCGPYQADTEPFGFAAYAVPCQEVLESGKIQVFYEPQTEFSHSPARYNYYLRIGETEILLENNDAPLSDANLKAFSSGLKETKPSELPLELLQPY